MKTLLLTLALAITAQGSPDPAAALQRIPPPSPDPPADYAVGPQDVLSIMVFNEPELSSRYTVESDGTLSFPLIGRVEVGGLTLRQIEQRITAMLAEGYLRNPQLTITVEQYRSQHVFVMGEVRAPGRYALTGNMTLLEVLAQAGSTTASASSEVLVIHPRGERTTQGPVLPGDEDDASQEVTRVNMRDLQTGTLHNVAILDGDTVFVPKAETFFVTGHVRSPGSYVWERGMTVQQAISLSGGITERGSDRRIRIFRIVKGERKRISVNMTDFVQPGDTIEVPQRFF